MESVIIEIRNAEGGKDSKLLVNDMLDIYIRSAKTNDFLYKIQEIKDGFASIWLQGKNVKSFFSNESGCHRFVRVPPTEKNGRTQTSTITIAVIDPSQKFQFKLNRNEVDKKYVRSQGKGGQNVNKTSSCVQLTHTPTGIQVKVQDTRDQKKNEEIAWKRLEDKLKNIEEVEFNNIQQTSLYNQTFNSGRSFKKRTYRVKEDIVIDHVSGKSTSFKNILRGKLELLR